MKIFKSLSHWFRSLFHTFSSKHQDNKKVTAFYYRFLERNNRKVVDPFLNGIGVKYCYLSDRVVVVLENDYLLQRCNHMDFRPLGFTLPAGPDRELQLEIELSGGLTEYRLYHEGYNIELQIVDEETWINIRHTFLLASALGLRPEDFYPAFLKLYAPMVEIMSMDKTREIPNSAPRFHSVGIDDSSQVDFASPYCEPEKVREECLHV